MSVSVMDISTYSAFTQPKLSQLLRLSKPFQAIFEGHGGFLALTVDDGRQFERPVGPDKAAACAIGMGFYAPLNVVGDANVERASFAQKGIDGPVPR